MAKSEMINEAERLANALLNQPDCLLQEAPRKRGVYLIRDKEKKIIYVGESRNLHTRIIKRHLSEDPDMSTSTFRRKLAKKFPELIPGKSMKEWIMKNCSFSFIEIEDTDLCHLVEALTIAVGRKENPDLLNGYQLKK